MHSELSVTDVRDVHYSANRLRMPYVVCVCIHTHTHTHTFSISKLNRLTCIGLDIADAVIWWFLTRGT
jgi:hypothetical protein